MATPPGRRARCGVTRHRAKPHIAALRRLEFDAQVTATPRQRAGLRWQCWWRWGLPSVAPPHGYRAGVVVLVAAISALYFIDLIFTAYLVTGSARRRNLSTAYEVTELTTWPNFTVLCPMYKETAVLPQFVKAIEALDYPRHALEVLLLLEEDDTETIDSAKSMNLPAWFEIIVVPDSQPKTKPKACNYGLQFARGEYLVIYDAEDRPEPDQLKKAVLAFAPAAPNVACLQARAQLLQPAREPADADVHARVQPVVRPHAAGPATARRCRSRWAARRTTSAPTSLRGLGGWDPYNVTEDADLGIRLPQAGLSRRHVDSTTYEEANCRTFGTGSGSARAGSRATCRPSWCTLAAAGICAVPATNTS